MHVQLPDWELESLAEMKLLVGELTGFSQLLDEES